MVKKEIHNVDESIPNVDVLRDPPSISYAIGWNIKWIVAILLLP